MSILKIYQNIFSYLKQNRKFLAFVFLFLIEGIVYCLLNSEPDISHYLSYYESNRPQYGSTFSFIFFENTQAMLQPICFGFIPFFLGTMLHSVTGISILVSSCKFILPETPITVFIAGTVPHGIFEIPAMVFSVILSSIISKEITLALLSFVTKKKFDNPKAIFIKQGIKETAIFVAESLAFIVAPLVFTGAFVESFITGWILEIFV